MQWAAGGMPPIEALWDSEWRVSCVCVTNTSHTVSDGYPHFFQGVLPGLACVTHGSSLCDSRMESGLVCFDSRPGVGRGLTVRSLEGSLWGNRIYSVLAFPRTSI